MSRELPNHEILEGIGHEDRGTTIVTAFDLDCGDDENAIPLISLVENLRKILGSIPPEHRESAKLNIKAYGDYASAYADVTWDRPETDDELADRRRWLKSLDDEREQRDRHEFARLKEKYKSL